MPHLRYTHAALLISLLPLGGCAAGDDSFLSGASSNVTPQSTGDDGGTTDGGPSTTPVPSGDDSSTTPPSGDDSSSSTPPSGNDASTPPSGDDSSAPPSGDDSSAPPADANPTPPPVDSGGGGSCPGYAPPNVSANCYCDPTLHSCTPNGCYNGYYCHIVVSPEKCVPKPSGC